MPHPAFSNSDIARIGAGLRDRMLPKSDWTHAAHVAAAVWCLGEHGREAERVMPGLIRAYNRATGVPNTDTGGFHHTITLASLRKVRAVMGEGSAAARYMAAMDAGLSRADWLLAHYAPETLFSVAARRGWVAPDRAPLP